MTALARPPRRSGCDRPIVRRVPERTRIRPRPDRAGFHFHFANQFRTTRRLAFMLDSLVRVSRRVGRVADATTDPGRHGVNGPSGSGTRACTEDSARSTYRRPTNRNPERTRRYLSSLRYAGPYHPCPVTLAPKRELPWRGASDRRQSGRGSRPVLVR